MNLINTFIEINDKEKEKLIHQMAYGCAPPDYPNVEEILKQRRGKRIDIEITPRTRQGECKKYHFYNFIGNK